MKYTFFLNFYSKEKLECTQIPYHLDYLIPNCAANLPHIFPPFQRY